MIELKVKSQELQVRYVYLLLRMDHASYRNKAYLLASFNLMPQAHRISIQHFW